KSHIIHVSNRTNKTHVPNNTATKKMFMKSIINSFTHLFHPDNKETKAEKQEHIHTLLHDETIRKQLTHLRGSLQACIVRQLMKRKSTKGIYTFFHVKQRIKTRAHPLYIFLKKIDARTKEVIHL